MIRTARSDTSYFLPQLPGDSNRVTAAPEHEREDQVENDDGDDAEPDGPAHGYAHALRAARGVEAVVAVDQGDGHREDAHLGQAVDDVDERQVQVEIVVVDARREPEELRGDQVGGAVACVEGDQVEGDDRQQGGDHPRANEVDERRHRHDLEGVDLICTRV